MKNPEARNRQNEQDYLKEELLSGNLSPTDFLGKVFALDQSTSDRIEAANNIKLLSDPSVYSLLEDDGDSSFEFHNLLSLSYFHIGQQKLLANDLSGQRECEQALQEAQKINADGYEDWRLYIEATLAYLNKDKRLLKSLVGQLADGPNKEIAQHMLEGLEKFDVIDYQRDYVQ